MGTHQTGHRGRGGPANLIRLVLLGLGVAAVVKELRTPPDQRTWHGVVAGAVPYDFRRPTLARFRERMWDPDNHQLIMPRVFGVGWTLNIGRVVAVVRRRLLGT